MNKRPFSVSEKKLFALCIVLIVLPMGFGFYWNRINATPFVRIAAYPKAPAPNGTDLYVAAAKAIVPATPAIDAIVDDSGGPDGDDAFFRDAKRRAARYSLARKSAWLRANRPAFALFERALKTPTLATEGRSGKSNREFDALRQLARYKLAQSNALWSRGDYKACFDVGLDTVQMGYDIRRGGGIMAHRTGGAISLLGRSAMQGTIEHLSAGEAKTGARRLEGLLENQFSLAEALEEEKNVALKGILRHFADPDWRAHRSSNPYFTLAEKAQVYTVSKQQIVDDIQKVFDEHIAIARLPYAQEYPALTTPRNAAIDVYYEGFVPLFPSVRNLAGDQMVMLSLALRAYRLENGAYPARLQNLTPAYLNAIPADPFGAGESWRYRREGQNYRLWSIGPDGKDEGGQPIARVDNSRQWFPDERVNLPPVLLASQGDYVAGKNE